MGNFYSSNSIVPENLNNYNRTKTAIDPTHLTKLRYWERDIQWDNWNRSQSSTNVPKHMPKLKEWEKKINTANLYR